MNAPVPSVAAAGPAADSWFANYRADDYLFVSPTASVLGRDAALTLAPGPEPLWQRAADLLAEAQNSGIAAPVLIGAVPFDASRPARLVVPRQCQLDGPLDRRSMKPAAKTSIATPITMTSVPPEEGYEAAVTDALERFAARELDKVVLARTLDITLTSPPDRPMLMRSLLQRNPHGFTFAIPLDDSQTDAGNPPVFLGASPELLLRRQGRRVILNPLAGSAARQADPVADRAAADALLASAKDRHEHAIVIDSIAAALRPYCRDLRLPDGPTLTSTDALWHLSTWIEAELDDPAVSSLELALALHPTPAVCGHPTGAAFAAIHDLEPFDRGFFAGLVGWCDAQGDGEWAVSLRCAESDGASLRLYAGAGVVPGSEPARELAETGVKFRTMLAALGLMTSQQPASGRD
ncbi:isochorismate synthase [Pigmentiphaga aceris]|uniref:isochorismate synthase n=1 Tax=Pigmentiphaga aceris TaxID=1940612 RepID=A0A5C0B2R6_9BURK|nr:isochorismate synthase [Pigmentiphaga aceris]QEI08852.1 isochorismate synthase [Pigmentiphaga aceris]